MTWNQSLNVNSWYSFVIVLLPRCLIVYGWQCAPCKVILPVFQDTAASQLWVEVVRAYCSAKAIPSLGRTLFSQRVACQCQVPKPKWDTGTIEERMMWWFQALPSARGWNAVDTLGSPWQTPGLSSISSKRHNLQALIYAYLWDRTVSSTDMLY